MGGALLQAWQAPLLLGEVAEQVAPARLVGLGPRAEQHEGRPRVGVVQLLRQGLPVQAQQALCALCMHAHSLSSALTSAGGLGPCRGMSRSAPATQRTGPLEVTPLSLPHDACGVLLQSNLACARRLLAGFHSCQGWPRQEHAPVQPGCVTEYVMFAAQCWGPQLIPTGALVQLWHAQQAQRAQRAPSSSRPDMTAVCHMGIHWVVKNSACQTPPLAPETRNPDALPACLIEQAPGLDWTTPSQPSCQPGWCEACAVTQLKHLQMRVTSVTTSTCHQELSMVYLLENRWPGLLP